MTDKTDTPLTFGSSFNEFGETTRWSITLKDLGLMIQCAIASAIIMPLTSYSKWRLRYLVLHMSTIAGFGLAVGVMGTILFSKILGGIIDFIWGAYL